MAVALLTDTSPKPWLDIYCNSINQLHPPAPDYTSLTLLPPGTITTPGTINCNTLNATSIDLTPPGTFTTIGDIDCNALTTTGTIDAGVVNSVILNGTVLNLTPPGTLTTIGNIDCNSLTTTGTVNVGVLNADTINNSVAIATGSIAATNATVVNLLSGAAASFTGIVTSTGLLVKPATPIGPNGTHTVSVNQSGQNIGITSIIGNIVINLPPPTAGFKVKFTFTSQFGLSFNITWTNGFNNLIGIQYWGAATTQAISGDTLTNPTTPVTNLVLTTSPETVIARGDYVKFWCVDALTMYFTIVSVGYPNTSWSTS